MRRLSYNEANEICGGGTNLLNINQMALDFHLLLSFQDDGYVYFLSFTPRGRLKRCKQDSKQFAARVLNTPVHAFRMVHRQMNIVTIIPVVSGTYRPLSLADISIGYRLKTRLRSCLQTFTLVEALSQKHINHDSWFQACDKLGIDGCIDTIKHKFKTAA